MRRILISLMLSGGIFICQAQSGNPFSTPCVEAANVQYMAPNPNPPQDSNYVPDINCGHTSPYYSNQNLYTPHATDDIIYIKLNFIFLTKPDGTGNFEQNNPEHQQVIDDIINAMNYKMGHLTGTPSPGCDGYGQSIIADTRIRVVVNKIWKADPGWNFLISGYDPNQGPLGGTMPLYPPSPYYYYTYLDNDPSIPPGLNVVFANNGSTYNDFMVGNYANYPNGPKDQWAASQFPFSPNSGKLRQFYPDFFNKYIWMKNFVVGNPTWNSPSWPVVRSWFVGNGSGFCHELGHNLSLGHRDCGSIMNDLWTASHDYFSTNDISSMYKAASITNVRQYFTESSFKNTTINVTANELWDLDVRHYSYVNVANNSSLKITCKLIMAPNTRVTVRNGSNFTIQGATIRSADNGAWDGVRVEGNGSCLILPDTKLDGYFHAYTTDRITTVESSRISGQGNDTNKPGDQNDIFDNIAVSEKGVTVFPNPATTRIRIDSKEKIASWQLLNYTGSCIAKGSETEINVQQLPRGYYMLIVVLENKQTVTRKIVLQ